MSAVFLDASQGDALAVLFDADLTANAPAVDSDDAIAGVDLLRRLNRDDLADAQAALLIS